MTGEHQNQNPAAAGPPSGNWWAGPESGQSPPSAFPNHMPPPPPTPGQLAGAPPSAFPNHMPPPPPTPGQLAGAPLAPPPGVAPSVNMLGGVPPSAAGQVNRTPLLIGAAVLVAAAVIAGGVVLFTGGQEEVSKSRYTKELCVAADRTSVDWIEAAMDTQGFDSSEHAGKEYVTMLEELEAHVKAIQAFNAEFQLSGAGGAALHADISESSTQLLTDLRTRREKFTKLIDDDADDAETLDAGMGDVLDFSNSPGLYARAILPMTFSSNVSHSSRAEETVADLNDDLADESECSDLHDLLQEQGGD